MLADVIAWIFRAIWFLVGETPRILCLVWHKYRWQSGRNEEDRTFKIESPVCQRCGHIKRTVWRSYKRETTHHEWKFDEKGSTL